MSNFPHPESDKSGRNGAPDGEHAAATDREMRRRNPTDRRPRRRVEAGREQALRLRGVRKAKGKRSEK